MCIRDSTYCHPYANGYADAFCDSHAITYPKFHAD